VFRKSAVILALLLGALSIGSPAHAAGTCAAVPDPVPVGTAYTVNATGLTVNTAFMVRIQQAGVPVQEVFATSDDFGNAATGDYGMPTAQEPGTVNATWKKLQIWPSGGGPIITYGPSEATCGWTIVA
jgi:hypothetical protein